MRVHFLYKFLHFPCINSFCPQTLMMKGYIHFIGRGCQWLFKEFRSPLSYLAKASVHSNQRCDSPSINLKEYGAYHA